MGKGSKIGGCKSTSHQLFKDRAKNRVDDLQCIFTDLQFARKESRSIDAVVFEEQVHQMLREWKAELNQPSPATSLQQDGSLGSFSTEIYRLLQLYDEEDDANSALAGPKAEPEYEKDLRIATQFDYQNYDLQLQQAEQNFFSFDNNYNEIACFLPSICPPPSAYLGPKCSLWDCPRPAQECQDYCSSFHAALAINEGLPGMTPVLRPGGIGLKDGLLFATLVSKSEGKDVGVPDCEGAATARSPWNVPELFDLMVLEGETIREWLFFDKPRRAFESGNRKQRSLPDYNGRGWHESRKQMINEYGGLKRSYYMDPQPRKDFEWHLYEYEIFKCDTCALYRLEFKMIDGKKNTKGKMTMARTSDSIIKIRGRAKSIISKEDQMTPNGEGFDYAAFDYLAENLDGYYLT
ncbi:transcription factor VOZ1-like [Impatiens glandulifera]|uniref:transcription factor VOZ1-like n=1 Tax=Impatiens glandulifera TaxID=253017 RepID=UPI001FB18E5E|nr:transcription factor VOZ1-like [Impatiens glandulifera]